MIVAHHGFEPEVHPDAYVSPDAVVRGRVNVGSGTRIFSGAMIEAGPDRVVIGRDCLVCDHAGLRAGSGYPLLIGSGVLIGPRARLTGCRIDDKALVAAGAWVMAGAVVGPGAEVQAKALIGPGAALPAESAAPRGWLVYGDPVRMRPLREGDLAPLTESMPAAFSGGAPVFWTEVAREGAWTSPVRHNLCR